MPQWDIFPAVLRGKIRLKGSTATNPVAVGDIVDFEAEVPEGVEAEVQEGYVTAGREGEMLSEIITLETPAVITSVHPRRNYVIRKSPTFPASPISLQPTLTAHFLW